jgi:hypothetical protein
LQYFAPVYVYFQVSYNFIMKPLIAKGVLEPETITSIVEEAKVLSDVSNQLVVITNGSTWQKVGVNSLEVFVHL